jgi:DNA-binding NarL/FixJ family response regulator
MHYSASHKARIHVVDDHPILREGITLLLNREPDLQVCCQAGTAEESLDACAACQPDLAVVDLSLAGISGLELVSRLHEQIPTLAILIISMHDETLYAERALRAGAKGYLMKQEATTAILQAIRTVLKGEIYLSERLRALLLQQQLAGKPAGSPVDTLTTSEFEIFNLLGKGMSIATIAQQLKRSASTIETHRASIKRKLGIASNSALTIFASHWLAGQPSPPKNPAE